MKRVLFILFTLLFVSGTTNMQAQRMKKLALKAIGQTEDSTNKEVKKE